MEERDKSRNLPPYIVEGRILLYRSGDLQNRKPSLSFFFLVVALLLPFHSLSQPILTLNTGRRMKEGIFEETRTRKDEERAVVRFFRSSLKII